MIKFHNLAQEQSSKNALAKRITRIMDSLAVTPWCDHGCECDCPKPCLKLTLIMPSICKRGPKELPSSRKWQQDLDACLSIASMTARSLMVDGFKWLFSKLQENYSSSNAINSRERTKRKVCVRTPYTRFRLSVGPCMVLMVCPGVTYRYLKWILACVQASLSRCKAAEILVLSIGAINRSICWILGTSNIGMGIQELYNSYNQPFAGHFTSSNLQYTKRVYTCAICTKYMLQLQVALHSSVHAH